MSVRGWQDDFEFLCRVPACTQRAGRDHHVAARRVDRLSVHVPARPLSPRERRSIRFSSSGSALSEFSRPLGRATPTLSPEEHKTPAGADAVLSVVPYYNKPTQPGLYAHAAQSPNLPACRLWLYDVPWRTACSLADETIARLAEIPNIVGLKDAAGDPTRPVRLRPLVGTPCGP
jgi:Dihydrodipicolinate synthetase family